MNHKTVAQLDDEGYFLGPALAEESPLEPGVFLIPGGAVDVALPSVPEGQRARLVDFAWVLEPVAPALDGAAALQAPLARDALAECKAGARARLEATDWAELPSARAAMLNAAAFDEYRAAVRALFIAPVEEPLWPEMPQPLWLPLQAETASSAADL